MDEQEAYDMEQQFNNTKLQNELMQQQQQETLLNQQSQGTIKEQLNLDDEIRKLDHLLRGHINTTDENGEMVWSEPKNNEDVLLTESGINLIMKIVRWYMNKNTLLSAYDVETINAKMEDFSNALADALFMKYEKYFLYPTAKECQEKLIERLQKKQQDTIYTTELRGGKPDADEIWQKLVGEIDPTLERLKIKEQCIKDKLKMFDLLMRQVQDAIHSTYLRALAGQERKTLRQHIHVSETSNQQGPRVEDKSGFFKK